ncbi:hypothetical protein [Asticcacaulis sp. 201]|uniref:hypothetical protein n=1 Tax=Asticcacaulis sp. 201 TaxID=3028787 RepID=UPI002916478A|nr:hypothetical protein [Asticcacaulis sp. 201]MDV6332233.1 hypothetical protein [Asticcacaulis sp. 201]
MSNLQSDIDYIKSLAEDGSKGPLKNGATLFCAGLIYGVAAIAHYAMIMNWIPKSGAMSAVIWIGASILFGICATVFGINRMRVKGSVSNRATASAWSAVGIGIFSFIACLVIIANIYQTFEPLSYLIAPVILLLYGMGWWVSALMSGQGWLKLVSFGCFLGAPAISFLAGNALQMLAYAACLFLFAMVPGIVLMRADRA